MVILYLTRIESKGPYSTVPFRTIQIGTVHQSTHSTHSLTKPTSTYYRPPQPSSSSPHQIPASHPFPFLSIASQLRLKHFDPIYPVSLYRPSYRNCAEFHSTISPFCLPRQLKSHRVFKGLNQ